MSNVPLVMLHGALGSAEMWKPLQDLLADRQTLTFNFSGHGGRVCSEPFSMDMFTDDLQRFISDKNLQQIDLLGYSMGGYVALKYAAENPGVVRKVMTLGTKFAWNPESAEAERRMLNPEVIEEKVPQFASVLADRHAPVDWKNVVRNTAQLIYRLGNGEAINFAESGPSCPVLITVGDVDRVVKFGEAVAVANALPDGRFQPVPGAGHPLEQVPMATLANMVTDFFD